MAIRPFWQAPRDSRRPLWNQAGRYRRGSSGALEFGTHSSKTTFLGFVAVLSLLLAVFGLHPLLLLLLAGGVACASTLRTSRVSLSVLSSVNVGSGTVATASFSEKCEFSTGLSRAELLRDRRLIAPD